MSNFAKHKTNLDHIGNLPEGTHLSNRKGNLNQIIAVLKKREERAHQETLEQFLFPPAVFYLPLPRQQQRGVDRLHFFDLKLYWTMCKSLLRQILLNFSYASSLPTAKEQKEFFLRRLRSTSCLNWGEFLSVRAKLAKAWWCVCMLFTALEGNISNLLGCALTVTSGNYSPMHFKAKKTQPSKTEAVTDGHYAPGRDFMDKSHVWLLSVPAMVEKERRLRKGTEF